jgi:hypothetical protein
MMMMMMIVLVVMVVMVKKKKKKNILMWILREVFLICIGVGGVQTGSTRQVGQLLAYCTCPG